MQQNELGTRIMTVVVIIDDITQLNLLSGLLRKEGIEVMTFESAEDALSSMEQSKTPDLIITDLYMPGIDGWQFCRLLRSSEYEAYNQTPILVVSSTFSGDDISSITADLGANAFLPSPVDGKKFTEVAQALLRGEKPRDQLRALIVEDSKSLVMLFKKAFEYNGHLVDTAFTVQEAEAAFGRTSYNIAIIDYHLPDGNGDTLLANFQSDQPECVCIMITSDQDPKLALDWMRQGAAAYLRKPFDSEYLVELCVKARRERALLRVEDLLDERTRQLQESEQFNKGILNDMISLVAALDPCGNIIFVNNTILRIGGMELEEVRGMKLHDTFWWSYSDEAREEIKRDIEQCASGKSIMHDIQLQTADGSLIWIEYSMHPVYDKHGIVQYLIPEGRNITERKKAEDALRESEERLMAIFKASPDPIVVYNIHGHPQYMNPAFNQVFGWTLGELQGRQIPFVPDDEKERISTDIKKLYNDREPTRIGTRRLTKDGRTLDIFLNASLIEGPEGEPVGTVVNLTDITERKKLEIQLQQAQKMEAIGTLAAGIAHDFNNILFPIMGYTEIVIAEMPEHSEARKNLNEVLKGAMRAKDLVQQILSFSRQQNQELKPLKVQLVVKEALKLIRSSLPATIEIHQNFKEDCGLVIADPTQIHQIIMNLCTNAYHAMEENGGALEVNLNKVDLTVDEITCQGMEPGPYLCLKVGDTGHGMEQDVVQRIFDPYFTTKEHGKGTGLGLSVVHGIVKSIGGDICVYSEPGKGTVFHVYLPMIKETLVPEKTEMSGILPVGNEHILLVDDEESIVSLVKKMITSFGYQVTSRTSSIEALEAFRAQPDKFDMVITDTNMPNMTGDKLAMELMNIRPEIPIILCTGFSERMTKETADALGIKGYLMKPIVMKELAEVIRKTLDNG